MLLLEAGGENDSFWVLLPKGVAKLVQKPEYMWAYPVAQPREEGAEGNGELDTRQAPGRLVRDQRYDLEPRRNRRL